jgi:hypothetical protein
MSTSKDKRTKGQILRMLDNAMTQEELLAGKIKILETELADCRKKADDPRHEITEEAMPASKVSFRIDYYRTSEESPLKGIIEHLPSRQNKSFEGEGQLIINQFMSRFLTEETGKGKKKKTSVEEKTQPDPVPVVESEKRMKAMQEVVLQEETATPGTGLLQRLKAQYAAGNQQSSNPSPQFSGMKKVSAPPLVPPQQQSSRLMQRLRTQHAVVVSPESKGIVTPPPNMMENIPARRSRLSDRLLAERQSSLIGKK